MGWRRSSIFLGNTLIGLKRKDCNDFFNEFKFVVKFFKNWTNDDIWMNLCHMMNHFIINNQIIW